MRSHKIVEPSTSVNKNVTVPDGAEPTTTTVSHPHRTPGVASGTHVSAAIDLDLVEADQDGSADRPTAALTGGIGSTASAGGLHLAACPSTTSGSHPGDRPDHQIDVYMHPSEPAASRCGRSSQSCGSYAASARLAAIGPTWHASAHSRVEARELPMAISTDQARSLIERLVDAMNNRDFDTLDDVVAARLRAALPGHATARGPTASMTSRRSFAPTWQPFRTTFRPSRTLPPTGI